MGLIKWLFSKFEEKPDYFIHRVPDTDNYFSYHIAKIFNFYEVIDEYRVNGELFNDVKEFRDRYDAYCYVKRSMDRKLAILKEAQQFHETSNKKFKSELKDENRL